MIKKNQVFIPAYQVLSEKSEKVTNTINDYCIYLEILKEHSIDNCEEYLQKMFMVDFILANEDRHLGNFGVVRNLDTLKWEGICPIFDTGRSLDTNVSKDYWLDKKVDMKFFTKQFIDSDMIVDFFSIMIEKEMIDKMYKLPDIFEKYLKQFQDILLFNDNDILLLKRSFNNRIRLFEEIMIKKNLVN